MSLAVQPFQPVLNNVLTTQRIYSIDALRGITILTMIFVNEVAGVSGMPTWMKHAAANADTMTFVDIVFPSFLFIVGMSIPFAINNRIKKGDSYMDLLKHVSFRTIGLLLLGVFMVNAEGGYDENAMVIPLALWSLLFFMDVILIWNSYPNLNKSVVLAIRICGIAALIVLALIYKGEGGTGLTPQWWGILGLIGWAYFFSCLLYIASRGSLPVIITLIVVCIAWFVLGVELKGSGGIFDFVNSQKGHATHTSLVLSGIVASLLVFDERKVRPLHTRILRVGVFVIAATVIAIALRSNYSISKIFATPSWAMFCVAICATLFVVLYWLIDVLGVRNWTKFIEPAASNPLLTYIIPYIVFAVMTLLNLHWPNVFLTGVTGVIWCLVYAFSVVGMIIFLNKAKIKLQL